MPARHIVVGVDFSEASLDAARWTAQHLGRESTLILAHAVCVPEPPRFLQGLYPPIQPALDDARHGAESRLRDLSGSLGAGQVRTEVRVGRRPDEELSRLAEEISADLLVVGSHGERSGVWRLLGSTAERLARRASNTSLLLARDLRPEGLRTILVGVDESDVAPQVLEWAFHLARELRAGVVALHVVNRLLLGATRMAASDTERKRANEQLQLQTEEWIRQQIPAAGAEDLKIEAAVGDTGLEMLSAAERYGADLLVIGRHGARRASGGFLGSVAEFVLRNGSGPVLLVARGH